MKDFGAYSQLVSDFRRKKRRKAREAEGDFLAVDRQPLVSA